MLLKIQKVVDYIHANLDKRITADDLARAARLSRSRLCYLFKAEMGVAPMQYLKRSRIEKARDLLENTPLSVKEIRSMVGFSDRSHFTRGFKETFGVTPFEYRRTKSENSASDYKR
jgi:transcriptional regulator GlxA family with amidase domain